MKYSYLLISLLLSFNGIRAQQQAEVEYDYKAVYGLTFQQDSTDISSIAEETVLLYLNPNQSRYLSLGQQTKDSLFATLDRNTKSMAQFSRIRAMIPKTAFNYIIFKSTKKQQLLYAEKIVKDKFKYVENLPLQSWEIQTETKAYLGYTVQRATTTFAGRKYTAWFTAALPFSDGPYKFGGLPGLILEIYDAQKNYHFSLKGFEKLKEPVQPNIRLNTYKRVTKADFLQIKEHYEQDPLDAMESAGIKLDFSNSSLSRAQAKQDLRASHQKKNNAIELLNN